MLVGYARVSAVHQNLDRQLVLLRAAGCKRIFKERSPAEKASGAPNLKEQSRYSDRRMYLC